MPKTRAQKEATLAKLLESFKATKSVIFAGFSGLNVKDTTELRRLLRAEGVEVTVAKRTLLRRTFKELNLPEPGDEVFAGGVQVAFGLQDEVAPARIIHQFAKKHDALKLRGGFIGSSVLSKEQVVALAQLPGQDALRGQFVSVLAAPLRGLVTVLAGPIRGFVTVLSKKPA